MVTPTRAITLLLALAILLAGPASALAASFGGCCCSQTAAEEVMQADAPSEHSCCSAAPEQSEPAQDEPCHDEDSQSCDCSMPCCMMAKTPQLARATIGLDLPDAEPDAFHGLEPVSHAVEAHFSLLRPPRS